MVPRLDLSPLMDLALVLTLVLLVHTPRPISAVGVKMPSGLSTIACGGMTETSVLAQHPDGRLSLDRRIMSVDQIRQTLTDRLRTSASKRVWVDAHTDAAIGDVVALVGLARGAGAHRVSLTKLRRGRPLRPTAVALGAGVAAGVVAYTHGVIVRPGTPLDKDQATAALQAVQGKLDACYRPRLDDLPGLTGTLYAYLPVGPRGELLEAPRIDADSVGDRALRDCVRGVLADLVLPPLGEGRTAGVHYGMLFSPG